MVEGKRCGCVVAEVVDDDFYVAEFSKDGVCELDEVFFVGEVSLEGSAAVAECVGEFFGFGVFFVVL